MVDGKRKLVQVIKLDDGGNPAKAKLACDRAATQDKVHAIIGANGSHLVKIMNQTAERYKLIALNNVSMADDLQDATNFSKYAFQTWYQTSQAGRAFGYFYGQIRKKEKKFYIICQDYLFGHDLAESFKKGLKEYFPEAQVVGEDFHRLFMTDFAPYLTKIKASGAEVIFTGNWGPDATNLVKQARQMGINIPIAHIFISNPSDLVPLGVEGTKNMFQASCYVNGNPEFPTPEAFKFHQLMTSLYKKFKPPYNSRNFEQGWDPLTMPIYWMLSVFERAASTDPEKIIKVWEGDTFQYIKGHQMKMRACDHNTVQDIHVIEFAPPDQQKAAYNYPPYRWTNDYSFWGKAYRIPAENVLPWMDSKLERCKGKNPSGN